jgi:hypothetical protein
MEPLKKYTLYLPPYIRKWKIEWHDDTQEKISTLKNKLEKVQ